MRTNLILAILAVLLGIPTWLTIRAEGTRFTEYAEIPLLFPGFTRENVEMVCLSVPQRSADGEVVRTPDGDVMRDVLQFVRQDDGWVLGNTDLQGVGIQAAKLRESVFVHLEAVRIDEKALARPDAAEAELERHGLLPDQALLIQCFDRYAPLEHLQAARPLAELFVGKSTNAGQVGEQLVRGRYVRRPDSRDIVLYELEQWTLSANRDDWVDPTPLRFRVDEAIELTLHNSRPEDRYETTTVTVRRDGRDAPDWQKVEGPEDAGPVRNAEVRALLQTLASINVRRYVTRLPADAEQRTALLAEHGLAEPKLYAHVRFADGTEQRIAIGDQVPGQPEYHLVIDGVDFLMTVGAWILSPLTSRSPADLFDPR